MASLEKRARVAETEEKLDNNGKKDAFLETCCGGIGASGAQKKVGHSVCHRLDTTKFTHASFRFPMARTRLQKHFPPNPRKTAWDSDIANVISPHGVPQTRHKIQECNTKPPKHHQSSSTPATRCFSFLDGPKPFKHILLRQRQHRCKFATQCATD